MELFPIPASVLIDCSVCVFQLEPKQPAPAECGDGQHRVGVGHPVRREHQGLPLPLAGPQGAVPSSRRVSIHYLRCPARSALKCLDISGRGGGALQQSQELWQL